jgi:transcriptional regulator of arginine metabolism
MSAQRHRRQLKLLELVSARELRTQQDLADALAAEGWHPTQSTISRDIAVLKLVKVDGVYRRTTAAAAADVDPDRLRILEGVLTVDAAGDILLVLRTPPGEANRVAVALDRLAWPEVVGTLAGDDTVFVAVRDRSALRRARGRLSGMLKARPALYSARV